MKKRLLVVAVFLVSVSCARAVDDVVYVDVDRPDVAEFIDEMVVKHEFGRETLRNVLSQARIKASIIRKISTPAERTLTWGEYRKIFITKERINVGTAFWRENREILERISEESGVSVAMIVGIIGVETYYGRITGKDRVIDALATLAFDYPPRSKFFRKELTEFLVLAREEEIDATEPMGSYAGAMGRPQFMPSSFLRYAVDYDGDGRRDIWNTLPDVFASIANYLSKSGWNDKYTWGRPVQLAAASKASTGDGGLKVVKSLPEWQSLGIRRENGRNLPSVALNASLLLTDEGAGPTYLVYNNFRVLMVWNRSTYFALTVSELSDLIQR